MRQRMAPNIVLYGPRRLDTLLASKENFINWEALRLSWEMPGQSDSPSLKILSRKRCSLFIASCCAALPSG